MSGFESLAARYPAIVVEIGAVIVLASALIARFLSRRFGIPSIVTLLACGLVAGPSVLGVVRVDLTRPPTRALLSLAVVIILFEVTLRVDLRRIPKLAIGLLATLGTALTLALLPAVARSFGSSRLLAVMTAAICVVTGPTVIGPLMARLRPRSALAHLLETEGLVLDALGVIIASAVFASFTSRPSTPLDTALYGGLRVASGLAVGAIFGVAGGAVLHALRRASSDISKIATLLLAFGTYTCAEAVSHESGLAAVVACGLIVDFRSLPHERPLRSFKEDLSMFALSTVFVLLASQIQIARLGPLVVPALALTGALILIRVATVAVASSAVKLSWSERLLMATIFPRGVVAISLATYYATQLRAWDLRGGQTLAGTVFLIVIFTIALSTGSAMAVSAAFRLQMPALALLGITPQTLECARRFRDRGFLPLLLDRDELAVGFARSADLDAEAIESPGDFAAVIRERKTGFVVTEHIERWRDFLLRAGALPVLEPGSSEEAVLLNAASEAGTSES